MRVMTKWLNVELEKDLADKLRVYLKEQEIKFETSQAGDLTHFEILVTSREMKIAINRTLLKFEIDQ